MVPAGPSTPVPATAASLATRRDSAPPPRSILIIKPSSLGDVIHTLPAVALVKRRWPDARLSWLINPEWAALLDGNPHVDEAVPFPRREFRGLGGSLRVVPWARRLRERVQADLVLDFQGLLRSALIARLCRAPRGRIVGLSDAREGSRWLYDEAVDVSEVLHAVDRYLAMVGALGIETELPLAWPLPAGTPPAAFNGSQPFLLLHPFARGEGKSLTLTEIEALCHALTPHTVVLAGRTEAQIAPTANAINLLNRTTLAELIWLIRRAAFVVSVDSGPMHIAAALTSRLLSIHTWSDPRKVGPYRPEAWIYKDRALFQQKHASEPAQWRRDVDQAGLAEFILRQLPGLP